MQAVVYWHSSFYLAKFKTHSFINQTKIKSSHLLFSGSSRCRECSALSSVVSRGWLYGASAWNLEPHTSPLACPPSWPAAERDSNCQSHCRNQDRKMGRLKLCHCFKIIDILQKYCDYNAQLLCIIQVADVTLTKRKHEKMKWMNTQSYIYKVGKLRNVNRKKLEPCIRYSGFGWRT